jgi:hypothetical protein
MTMRVFGLLLLVSLLATPVTAQRGGIHAVLDRSKSSDQLDSKDYSYEEWDIKIRKVGWARTGKRQTECDRLTANENDPGLTAIPVEFSDIDVQAALKACQADLANDPENGRLMNNLGRAYNKANDYLQSFQWTERAARAGHPYAHHAMALHYLYGESVDKDRRKEIEWLEKGREKGVPISSFRLASLALEDYERRDYDAAHVRTLLEEAGQGRSSSWAWGDFYFYEAIRFFHGPNALSLYRVGAGVGADRYKKGELPDGRDLSVKFGPALITEFRNLLRSAQAHYEDAERAGKNKARQRRLKAIQECLGEIRYRYAMR